MAEHRDCRDIVCNLCVLCAVNGLSVLAEHDHHERDREDRAEFYCKEHAGLAVHVEEVVEVHVVCCSEHDGSSVTDERCRTLKIG